LWLLVPQIIDSVWMNTSCRRSPNVRRWEAIPERHFRPYHPAGDDNPNLKIARSVTCIN
jgi:hypothetical protein